MRGMATRLPPAEGVYEIPIMVAENDRMESCEFGAGGVAVKTRETVPPVEQLTRQPPPGTPLQEQRANEPRSRRNVVPM